MLPDFISDHDCLAKDVVLHNLRSNYACQYSARVKSHTNVQILIVNLVCLLRALLYILDCLNHHVCGIEASVRLINDNRSIPLCLVDTTTVAHDDILVADGLHFVDLILESDLIEAGEQS